MTYKYQGGKRKMTEKQEETCENCGHIKKEHHKGNVYHVVGKVGVRISECKKFKAKNHSPFKEIIRDKKGNITEIKDYSPQNLMPSRVNSEDTPSEKFKSEPEGTHSQDASTRKDEGIISDGNNSVVNCHPDTKEFDLSEKIAKIVKGGIFKDKPVPSLWIEVEDVREFIRRLKEHFYAQDFSDDDTFEEYMEFIDKLAGKNLI